MKVTLRSPAPGFVLTGNSFAAAVSANYRIDCDYAGKAPLPGIGHYHARLDGSLIDMMCASRSDPISMQNVTPGRHTLSLIPAMNNHMEVMQGTATLPFVYRPARPLPVIKPIHFAGKPSVTILSPKPGTTVHGTLYVTVAVRNLRLSCDLFGKKDLAGWGHWHLNVDSAKPGMMGMATMIDMSCTPSLHFSLTGIKPGPHRFFVTLVDNQHKPTIGAQGSEVLSVR